MTKRTDWMGKAVDVHFEKAGIWVGVRDNDSRLRHHENVSESSMARLTALAGLAVIQEQAIIHPHANGWQWRALTNALERGKEAEERALQNQLGWRAS